MFPLLPGPRPVRLAVEALEARDVPAAIPAADLPFAAEPVPASPAGETRPAQRPTPQGQPVATNTTPRWDPHQVAAHILRDFKELFAQEGNIWGIRDARVAYCGVIERDGRQVLDVRLALAVNGWSGEVYFHMKYAVRQVRHNEFRFTMTGTEVWWNGNKTAAFFILEAAVRAELGVVEVKVHDATVLTQGKSHAPVPTAFDVAGYAVYVGSHGLAAPAPGPWATGVSVRGLVEPV
jgi:hypothetical protein